MSGSRARSLARRCGALSAWSRRSLSAPSGVVVVVAFPSAALAGRFARFVVARLGVGVAVRRWVFPGSFVVSVPVSVGSAVGVSRVF